jgi:hypothetical protein
MADPYFVIESEGGTVFSNEIQSEGIGVEVTSRFTGGGLPPVTAQFDEGLGNGATYRGTRVQSRVLDFAAHCYGPSRVHLRSIVDRLSMVLAYPCTVTFVDPDEDETWYVTAVRTGGGDYSYGEDGDAGTSFVNIEWSMQSESPFWTADSLIRTADESDVLTTENYGTVPVSGVWRCTGPTNGFTVTNEDDSVLEFTGFIPEGQTVTIDGINGTVYDSDGGNRYNDLAGDPSFAVPVGLHEFAFGWDQSSVEFTDFLTRTNHVVNSSFVLDPATTGDWTLPTGFDWLDTDGVVRMRGVGAATTSKVRLEYDLTGLTVDKSYQVRIGLNQGLNFVGLVEAGWLRVLDSDNAVVASVAIHVQDLPGRPVRNLAPDEVVLDFVAPETDLKVRFQPITLTADGEYWEGVKQDGTGRATILYMSVAEPGEYFDGNTTDTATAEYDFLGTANASKSTEVTTYTTEEPIEGAGLALEVEYHPQRWLVI